MVYGIEDLERPDPGRLQNMLLLDVDMASSYQSTEESSWIAIQCTLTEVQRGLCRR